MITRKPQDPAAPVGITDLRLPGHLPADIHARNDRSEWSHTFVNSEHKTPPVDALYWQCASNILAIIISNLLETVLDSVRSSRVVLNPLTNREE